MSKFTIDLLNQITANYVIYSNSFLLIIGLIGNILLISVFLILRIFRRNQCAFYLIVEFAV